MEDIQGKISELLSDPDGINKIKSIAESLFKDGNDDQRNPPTPVSDTSQAGGFSPPDSFDISKIMGLMSVLNSNQNDRRSELLLALKPHLSSERRERVDKAVKLLKIVSLLPVLKEQGLLDLL